MNKKSHTSLGVTFIMLGILILVFAIIIWVNIALDTQFGQDFMKQFSPLASKVQYFFVRLISSISSR